MRAALLALALTIGGAGAAWAQEERSLAGIWHGEQERKVDYPEYLSAVLTQEGAALAGDGVINLCPACAGFMEYEVRWDGRIKDDRVTLNVTYVHRPFEPPVRFVGRLSDDGERIFGTLWSGDFAEPFILSRERNSITGE